MVVLVRQRSWTSSKMRPACSTPPPRCFYVLQVEAKKRELAALTQEARLRLLMTGYRHHCVYASRVQQVKHFKLQPSSRQPKMS